MAMLCRTNLLRNVGQSLRIVAIRPSSYGHEEYDLARAVKESRATMDDLPVPQGSWQEDYQNRNQRYNIQLGLATIIFASVLFVARTHPVFDLKNPDYKSVQIRNFD